MSLFNTIEFFIIDVAGKSVDCSQSSRGMEDLQKQRG